MLYISGGLAAGDIAEALEGKTFLSSVTMVSVLL